MFELEIGSISGPIVLSTVLRTVLPDFKNKHDLDICDLRNVQNFAKII